MSLQEFADNAAIVIYTLLVVGIIYGFYDCFTHHKKNDHKDGK